MVDAAEGDAPSVAIADAFMRLIEAAGRPMVVGEGTPGEKAAVEGAP